ncbi:hypothetical protein LguiA_036247 [Lonicera macranthoides]
MIDLMGCSITFWFFHGIPLSDGLMALLESNGTTEMDDPESTMSRVALLVEQLHANVSSPHEKELITTRLLGITRARKEARALLGSHAQAMPLFISILRHGTRVAKANIAATLSVLCKEDDLRLKVLLGGCVPPLLALLKSGTPEARKAAAEAIFEVSSGGLSDDHVGMKIFVTEGVVPALWEQLSSDEKPDKVVEGFVTGALRNLCGDKDGYWRATLDSGGVDVIVELLSSDNAVAQSNAASLLARLMLAFNDSIPKIIDSGAIKALLGLLGQKNDILVRASAAEALNVLSSSKLTKAKKAVVDAHGVPVLIGAVVAPSKECMKGEGGQALQGHATRALANICGGMSSLILYLGELSQSPRLSAPVADIIGALAYCLMVFEQKSDAEEGPFDATEIENTLAILLKPRDNKLVQDRLLEAMASLYGNASISKRLNQPEAKKVLVGLATMAAAEVQEYLILSLISLCCDGVSVWEAIQNREGIQLLISLLGLSGEQHQEYAVELLAILTDQIEDSKWAITAAGGIPPLVQLLETGSQKAREYAAHVLWNLSCHSEDIRACVESAGAVPAFLCLLKDGGPKGQEASAKALTTLVQGADSATINQLLALLLGDAPSSKAHIIRVLGHVLTMASESDLVHQGAAANKALRALVQILNSSNEETQEYAASVLADLFGTRQDICDSLAMDEVVNPCMKLLTSKTQVIAKNSARALGALSRSTKSSKFTKKMSYMAEGDVKPLIKLAKTSSIDSAEAAVAALANLLSDPHVADEALSEDVVSALTRVLGEGSYEGKKNASCALHQLLRHFPVEDVLSSNAQCRFTVLAIVDLLNSMDMDGTDAADALEVVALLARTKQSGKFTYPPWSALSEVPSSLEPLVHCLAEGPSILQDKAIEILSRLCGDQPVVLGDLLVSKSSSITSLANRIMNSNSLEVRVGGTALLICAAKEHKNQSMDLVYGSGYIKPLIYALVDMMKQNSSCGSLEIEVSTPRGFAERTPFQDGDDFPLPDPATVLGGTVALWLLSIISAFHVKSKVTVVEAGGLDALSYKLASYTSNPQAEFEDTEGIWISALLMAILFQDANVVSSPATVRVVPSLAQLLKSDEVIDRYFAAQAMASLVCSGNKGISLAIANSGAVAGLITLIGYVESDMPNLVALSEEFSLVRNPDQVVLERLFAIEDVRVGSTARKTIPLLVDLLRPMPDRPGAPPFAVRLLTRIADGSDTNKLYMAEAGALDALPKYLSLSPQDLTEATISELLRMLFSNPELLRYEAAVSSLNQLIAVLRLGSRHARLSAARALNELFDAENIRDCELATHAIQPLVDMLNAASESEQHAALATLIKLTLGNISKANSMAEVEGNPLEILYRILNSASSLELKSNAAQLCSILFVNSKFRAMPIASECIEPLILLMQSNIETAVESGVRAFERLLDDEQQVELAAAYDVINLLVNLVSGSNHLIIEASVGALIKLGKDRTPRKLDMVNAGVIDNCLALLPTAPSSLCSSVAELFRILTNSSAISKSSSAGNIVEPLFTVLLRPDFGLWGQHSALQALVNILEKPQSLSTLKLTPSQVIEPLISFLESPSQAIQQLGTELLSHLLDQEHFQQDITTKNAVVPLVQLAGIGILNLQQTAIKALEKISLIWPKAVADAGGIFELSKVIIQDDPQPTLPMLESAALVLCNVLRYNADYYFRVPLVVLVKMLHSHMEDTVTLSLNALIIQERTDASSAELMAEAGAIDALLDLLRSHQCEEASGRLLEALFNNVRVREMKVAKYAIAPLAQYLLDPQTKSESCRLLAALALGNSGILVIQELLLSPNAEVATQAALLIKFLFSNHTLQEYVSNELIRSLTGALEKELWSNGTFNVEVLKSINIIFANFSKLHVSEAATLCIHLFGCCSKSARSHFVSEALYVIYHNISPEWDEGFTWAFDVPPKGQKLHIQCKSKSTFGKTNLGRVTIQIDKVVSEGVYSGLFNLSTDTNREGASRTLEIEITWSNSITNEKETESESETRSHAENETRSQAENEARSQAENEADTTSLHENEAENRSPHENEAETQSQHENENENQSQAENESESQHENENETKNETQSQNENVNAKESV